jgi:hypothetical protein
LDSYYNIENLFDLSRSTNNSMALYSHVGAWRTYVSSKVNGLSLGYFLVGKGKSIWILVYHQDLD